jgi:formylglycine-generating enzyme required for sulfatase activity
MKTRWKLMMALLGAAGMTQAAMVTIGAAGNAADPDNGGTYGDVAYTYQISATEVTIAEFTASGAGSGNENYWNDGTRTVGTAAPASYVSLYEARKYCNWLTTGDVNSGYYGNGGNNMSGLSHDAYAAANGRTYFLPTEDEWYKAAYYTGTVGDLWSLYANGTDNVPIHGTTDGWNYYNNGYVNGSPNYTWTAGYGGKEQNDTYDMMGNVWEWMETSSGVIRGGSFGSNESYLRSSYRYGFDPSNENYSVGFRVVAVPEPATALSLVLGGLVVTGYRRIRKAYGL